MRTKHLLMAAFGILPLVLAGCANHLRDIENVSQEEEKKTLSVKYDLKLTPETIRDASYHVEIDKQESMEVKKFQVNTVKAIVTPYQGWREFYEVPAGIGLLPVSIGTHLVFICTFGIMPYEVPRYITNLSFTGMNWVDLGTLLVSALVLWTCTFIGRRNEMDRVDGVLFLLIWAAYMSYLMIHL